MAENTINKKEGGLLMTAGARLRLDKMMLMRMTMCQASACGGIVVM